jgi:very-short-patch-repair endonuclease
LSPLDPHEHDAGMKSNVVCYPDLRMAGASNSEIRAALGCCLLKLSRGVYSVIRRCHVRSHQCFQDFAADVAWLEYHEEGRHQDRAQVRRYGEHLKYLKVIHYPHYRTGDIVSGLSAARLHNIGTFNEPKQPVSVFHPVSSTSSSELIRRRKVIAEDDTCVIEGLRVTTAARTALDLRNELGSAAGFAAMEQVLRRHLLGSDEEAIFKRGYSPRLLDEVPGAVEELFRSPISRLSIGRKVASTLTGLLSPLSESYAESRASLNLHLLGLHEFTQQFNIGDDGRLLTKLDFLLPEDRVALYVDGTQKYVDGGFDTMNKESRQHNRLLAMGFKVVRFKFNEVLEPTKFGQKLFHQAPELRMRRKERLKL